MAGLFAEDTLQGAPGKEPGLWPAVGKLLRLRVVILASRFRRASTWGKIGWVLFGLLLLGALGFGFFVSWLLMRFVNSPELAQYVGDLRPILDLVPVGILGAAFAGVLLTSFGLLLQALYLAGDMDFLLSAPLPLRAVFLAKLLQAILPNFSLISLFALPVLWGLGAARGFNLLYYPLVLALLAAVALAAAGLSSLLVMLVARIFPARRVAEVLGFLGAIFSFLCSQTGNLAQFGDYSEQEAVQALSFLERFDQPWSPLTWAGAGLVGIGEGRWFTGLGFTLMTLLLCAGIFWIALATAERLYYTGWASIQGGKRRKRPRRANGPGIRLWSASAERRPAVLVWAGRALSRFEWLLPRDVRALIGKDFRMLQRDLRNMSHLVTPLIFGVVYAFIFLRGGGEDPSPGRDAPDWVRLAFENVALYANVGLSLFVSWMLVARLAGAGFSQEGKSYWLLKVAPVSPSHLLWAKFLVAFLPSAGLGWLFLLGISLFQEAAPGAVIYSLLVSALIIGGLTGVNLVFGVLGARFDWEDPRQMTQGSMGCLSGLIGFIHLPVSLLLFFGPPVAAVLLKQPEIYGQAAGLILGGLFSLASALAPVWFLGQRVSKLMES